MVLDCLSIWRSNFFNLDGVLLWRPASSLRTEGDQCCMHKMREISLNEPRQPLFTVTKPANPFFCSAREMAAYS